MKQLVRLIYLLPIVVIVILTNYFVDPANLFNHKGISNESDLYEQKIVDYLIEGYNVTNIESYNERIFNKLFIESLNFDPEVIVLGSSKTQLIDKNLIESKMFVNSSLTGATLEDMLAVYNVYHRNSKNLKKVYIEVSPWILNDNNGQTRWKSIEEEYNALLEKFDNVEKDITTKKFVDIPPEYLEIISFDYLQESFKFLINRKNSTDPFLFSDSAFVNGYVLDSLYHEFLKSGFSYKPEEGESKIDFLNRSLKKRDFYSQWLSLFPDYELLSEDQNLISETLNSKNVDRENIVKRNRKLMEATFWSHCPISEASSMYKTKNVENNGLTILTDGTITYPKDFRDRTLKQVDYAATATINSNLFGYDNYTEISEEKVQILISFLKFLKKNDLEVNLLFIPYHPIVYAEIEKKYWQVEKAKKTFSKIAKDLNIETIGEYAPKKLDMDGLDFYDGFHLKKESLRKLIK